MAEKKQAAYLAHCPDCVPYPANLPQSCFGPLIAALRGQIDDVPCVVHCGWTVAGWVLGTILGDDDHVHDAAAATMSKEEAAAALEQVSLAYFASSVGDGGDGGVGAINWKALLAVLMQLLVDLLK